MPRVIDPAKPVNEYAIRQQGYRSQRDMDRDISDSNRYLDAPKRILFARTLGPYSRDGCAAAATSSLSMWFATSGTTGIFDTVDLPMSRAGRVCGGWMMNRQNCTAGNARLVLRVIQANGTGGIDYEITDCEINATGTAAQKRAAETRWNYADGIDYAEGNLLRLRVKLSAGYLPTPDNFSGALYCVDEEPV